MALPTTYDALFRKHGTGIPVAFLRALAARESDFRPRESGYPGYGLLQIVPVVAQEAGYSHGAMLDAETNIKVGADLIRRIMGVYARHPSPNMKPDWTNPEFVKLLLAGWNSGYSDAGGVGRVARYLESRGIPVTHDNVFKHASAAGATRHLSNDGKRRWQAGVASLYFAQPDAPKGVGRFLIAAAGVTVAAILASRVLK